MSSPARRETKNGLQFFPREAEKKKTPCNLFPASSGTKKQPTMSSPRRREEKNDLQFFPRHVGNKKTACNPFPAPPGTKKQPAIFSPRRREQKKTGCNSFPAKRRTKKQPTIFSPPRRETKNGLQFFPRHVGRKYSHKNSLPVGPGRNRSKYPVSSAQGDRSDYQLPRVPLRVNPV